MRRLPIYLIFETSPDWVGEGIEGINSSFKKLLFKWRCNPHTLENLEISMITFGVEARQVLPLTPITKIFPLDIKLLGTTNHLGAALELLVNCIECEVDREKHLPPLVILFSDGYYIGDLEPALARLQQVDLLQLIACAISHKPNIEELQRVTNFVVSITNSSLHEGIDKMLTWLGKTDYFKLTNYHSLLSSLPPDIKRHFQMLSDQQQETTSTTVKNILTRNKA